MKWLMSVDSAVGASFPLMPLLNQLPTELDSAAIQRRLLAQEDSISTLHPDIRELSEKLYQKLVATGSTKLQFDNVFYTQYGRPLAILEKQGFIAGSGTLGAKHTDGFTLKNEYIIYLCALYEDQGKMDALVQLLESCKPDQRLRAEVIEPELQLSRPVIKVLFQLYEEKGLGKCLKEIGVVHYYGLA